MLSNFKFLDFEENNDETVVSKESKEDSNAFIDEDDESELKKNEEEPVTMTGHFKKQVSKKNFDEKVMKMILDEQDERLYYFKSTFFNFVKLNMKIQNYVIVHKANNIIDYLSDKSQDYFTLLINYTDAINNKIFCLYHWKLHGQNVFILGYDDIDDEWLSSRHNYYIHIANKGNKNGLYDKKTFSILRRNCFRDFTDKFTKTRFFNTLEEARYYISMNFSGEIRF